MLALPAGWSLIGTRIDDYAYDLLLSFNPPPAHQSACVIVAIDEATLNNEGGPRAYRTILAKGLDAIAAGKPAVVAIDMVLADAGDPREDQRLAEALQATSIWCSRPSSSMMATCGDGRTLCHSSKRLPPPWGTSEPTRNRTMA